MSLDEFSSHKVVLPAPSLPLPVQGGTEQRSATTSPPTPSPSGREGVHTLSLPPL